MAQFLLYAYPRIVRGMDLPPNHDAFREDGAVADAYDALSAVVTLDRERDGSAKHPTGLAATKPSNGSQRTTAALEETQAGGGLHVDSY